MELISQIPNQVLDSIHNFNYKYGGNTEGRSGAQNIFSKEVRVKRFKDHETLRIDWVTYLVLFCN